MGIRVFASELKTAAGDEDFRLQLAALEWSLAEPIIINSADDIKSSVDWKDRVEPFHHQVQNLMRFCRRLPVTLLADDVGLGKTISAGLIMAELMKRNRVSKVFVICPKILIPQWVEELDSKFGISAYGAVGKELREAHNRSESVIVTTYQSATGYLRRAETAGHFDMLVLDEAHKVRNLHGTPQPPQMATAIFNALEQRMFKYVVMLTATPIQNRLWDIYSLVDCLAVARGHKNPFGTPTQFGSRFIEDGVTTARRLNPRTAKEFRKIVNSYMFRTRRVDAKLAFPEREVQSYAVDPTEGEQKLQQIVAENISGFNGLLQTSLLVALMSSPQALAMQLENMASKGTASRALAEEVKDTVKRTPLPAKANAVLAIAKRLRKQRPDWRMVVFTTRKETQRILGKVLEQAGIKYGFIMGGSPAANLSTVNSFRRDNPEINVIVSTDAGAEGVNLQAANILVNYDLPWNPMIVEQRIGRVQRIGSKFKNVWVANVVHRNSPEQNIVARLMEKLQVISHTVGDIEAVLEATDDSGGETLEKQIRDMVIKSLKGQDQEQAASAAEQSIQEAKELIERSQEEMERTLGNSDEHEKSEVPMPRLQTIVPSMPLREFVIGALRAEGASVEELGDGLFSCQTDRQDDNFTFDEHVLERFNNRGVFMGRAPLLYQQGKPAFERLVQRWIDRSGARISDQRSYAGDLELLGKHWVGGISQARFLSVKIISRSERFVGRVVCRTRIANAVDSYEKLIDLPYKTNGHTPNVATELSHVIDAKRLLPELDSCISGTVESDLDIGQFKEFYEARLKLELRRSDSGKRKTKLVNDLGPGITAEASAVSGTITDRATLAVTFALEGTQEYESEIEVEAGGIVSEPARERCEVTEWELPIGCLERCVVTNKLVVLEKLKKSEVSGLYGIPDVFVTCEKSAKEVHQGETEVCCLSGKRVCKELLACSQMSGRYVLLERQAKCEITGDTVACDEVETSSLSGRRFRCDQSKHLSNGETAHESEVAQCSYSGEWVPKDQCETSEVTGQPVGRERLAYSELSNRKCDVSELVACEQTGNRLLPDEVGCCAETGVTLRKDLLHRCSETRKLVDKTILEECQESGEFALPTHVETCCLTGKQVRRTLLGASGVSGKVCLADRLVRCELTMESLLPQEVQQCEVTGKRVDVRLLKRCGATGKVALAERMVKSKASGKWLLTEHTQTLPDGAVVGKREVAFCNWTRKYVRIEHAAACSLSGMVFSKSLLNDSGELSILRKCLDGERRGKAFLEPGFLARVQPKIFSGILQFQWVSSTSKQAHILFGKKSTFGFNSKVFAVFAEGDTSGLSLRGNALFGKRSKGVWLRTESFPVDR